MIIKGFIKTGRSHTLWLCVVLNRNTTSHLLASKRL